MTHEIDPTKSTGKPWHGLEPATELDLGDMWPIVDAETPQPSEAVSNAPYFEAIDALKETGK